MNIDMLVNIGVNETVKPGTEAVNSMCVVMRQIMPSRRVDSQ